MSLSPRPVPISMSLPWRMPCCAAPAPEPHEPDTARPHTSPTTPPAGGAGKVRSKSGRLDAIHHVNLITQWKHVRGYNYRSACESLFYLVSSSVIAIGRQVLLFSIMGWRESCASPNDCPSMEVV